MGLAETSKADILQRLLSLQKEPAGSLIRRGLVTNNSDVMLRRVTAQ